MKIFWWVKNQRISHLMNEIIIKKKRNFSIINKYYNIYPVEILYWFQNWKVNWVYIIDHAETWHRHKRLVINCEARPVKLRVDSIFYSAFVFACAHLSFLLSIYIAWNFAHQTTQDTCCNKSRPAKKTAKKATPRRQDVIRVCHISLFRDIYYYF